MTCLYYSNNQLTSIPESISNLTIGEDLDLSYNMISSLPDNFWNIDVNFLLLNNNQLTSLPEINNELNIYGIDLSYNQLTSLPENLCNSFLEYYGVNVNNNQLCPIYPDCLTEDDIGFQDTSECPEYLMGDGNFDGFVDIRDIVLGIDFIVYNYDEMDMYEFYVFDINQDNSFDVIDIVQLIFIIIDE